MKGVQEMRLFSEGTMTTVRGCDANILCSLFVYFSNMEYGLLNSMDRMGTRVFHTRTCVYVLKPIQPNDDSRARDKEPTIFILVAGYV